MEHCTNAGALVALLDTGASYMRWYLVNCPSDVYNAEMRRLKGSATCRSQVTTINLVRGGTPDGRAYQLLLWKVDGNQTMELRKDVVSGHCTHFFNGVVY